MQPSNHVRYTIPFRKMILTFYGYVQTFSRPQWVDSKLRRDKLHEVYSLILRTHPVSALPF